MEATSTVREGVPLPNPLLLAIWNDDEAKVVELLSSTEPASRTKLLNEVGPNKETALHLALRCGRTTIAKLVTNTLHCPCTLSCTLLRVAAYRRGGLVQSPRSQ
jgi:hypothetical protein